MSILNVKHLSHDFGGRAIFQDVSFHLLKGEHTDLIRVGGEGKSVFVSVITGKLMLGGDKVEWAKSVRTGYLDQYAVLEKGMTIRNVLKNAFASLFETEEHMNQICDKMGKAGEDEMAAMMDKLGVIWDLLMAHDFYITDSKVEEMGRALSLADIGLDKSVTELPGGQHIRVLLGRLPLEGPDILLLDKPTNYLDVQHTGWLKRYLQEYENVLILISRDIPFLNNVINLIYRMENQRLNRCVGDYNKFWEVYAVKKSQLEAAYKRQQQGIVRLGGFAARNKARIATRNMAMFHQERLDKMDVIELARGKPRPEFHFVETHTPGKYILEIKDLTIGYGEPLSYPLNLIMERGQKIVLTGVDSTGKTALLKSILGLTPVLSGTVELGDYLSIGYLGREMIPGNITTCLQEIWNESPACTQYQVRSVLAKRGLTAEHIESQVRVLNGDRQVKIRLCKLTNRESNVLLLDELANHLGVDAKNELKRTLRKYKGSILLIYHEPGFFEGLAVDAWDCREWALKLPQSVSEVKTKSRP